MIERPRNEMPERVFNPPSSWHVDPGFVPYDGWTPDPAWGPVPEGWVLWLPRASATTDVRETSSDDSAVPSDRVSPDGDGGTSGLKPKKRWPFVVAAIVLVVLIVVATIALIQQQQKSAEELSAAKAGYDSSVSELSTSISDAEEALEESDGAVPKDTARDLLGNEIAEAQTSLTEPTNADDAEALSMQAKQLDDARRELENASKQVDEDVANFAELVAARKTTMDSIASARADISIAEKRLADSEGKVNDSGLRDDLAATIEDLRNQVDRDPNILDLGGLNSLNEELERASQKVWSAAGRVNGDQVEWQKSTDAAAATAKLLDPAAYASISSRAWLLVERNPAAHKDEKYILFGKVTQFDSNTGRAVFRANTDGEKQSRSYNYDVNTMATGTDEVLANVVQGDLVKLFVSVTGPYSYETTMGGKLTVPMVQANIVEVYGSD